MSELTVIEVIQILGNTKLPTMIIVDNVERFIKQEKSVTIKFVSGDSIMVDPDSLDTLQLQNK